MKIWKAKTRGKKQGVWGSEIRLRDADDKRLKQVRMLLKRLGTEVFDESLS